MISVDPSSPFSHGALLGDRIRLTEHFTDPGVFIRSMASRGHLGGVAGATADAVTLMDAFGFDVVLVETVGVGQSEIEIAEIADTILVALQPGRGDTVQMLKAGILEIADVFVVNKRDHPMALQLQREIRSMLEMLDYGGWVPHLVATQALEARGIDDALGCDRRARRVSAHVGRTRAQATRRATNTACARSRWARSTGASTVPSPACPTAAIRMRPRATCWRRFGVDRSAGEPPARRAPVRATVKGL